MVLLLLLLLLLVGGGQDGGRPAAIVSYVEPALGVLLLVVAAGQWRSRLRDGRATVLPAWLAAVDRVTVVRPAHWVCCCRRRARPRRPWSRSRWLQRSDWC